VNISYAWLRDIAPGIQDPPETLADRLGMLGAPVEELARPGAEIGDVVVARVVTARQHPNADRLSLCTVDAGEGEPIQVVCGAPNVEEGALYPFAPVGATLPGGLKLRKAKIRGEYSHGMLCSEKELGLGRDAGGIMRLSNGHQPGERLVEALSLDDARLTLEVTPNRPDLLSHVGVARELAPDGHAGIELPPFPAVDSGERTDATMPPLDIRRADREGQAGEVTVRIDDADACPRYMAAVIEGVTVGPSPAWLAGRLRAIGQRPINNVVDATNYVLFELGQPLHAFDLDRLGGPAIVVRPARSGETLTTLDDVERKLQESMLVIADAEDAVAVAGVMGGAESEVSAETSRVLLECAYFDPKSIRPTARALGLSTDASYRYERGTDVDGMDRALHRVLELIQAVAGGRVSAAVDVYPKPHEPVELELRPSRVTHLLGESIPTEEIEGLLTQIGFELRSAGEDVLTFAVPGFRRHDVAREVDLIEEVARRYGYDRFPDELRSYRPNRVPEAPLSALEDRLRDVCVGLGLLEARSVPMAPESAGEVRLLRPLSAEEGALQSTVVHGLLRAAELNLARGVRDIRLFELSTTFHAGPAGELPGEQARLGVVVSGARRPPHWGEAVADRDLWDVRGLAESLMAELDPEDGSVGPLGDEAPGDLALPGTYRPGHVFALRSGGELVGVAGAVSGDAVDAPAWAAPTFALELRLTDAMTHRRRPVLQPVPTQPAIDRDLALLVPESLPAGEVAETIRSSAGPLLERLDLFDVYTGSGVDEGVRSLAFRLVFRDRARTLKDEEVDEAVDRVLERLRDTHGVERRG
jgi:phenylalanyl-tRNA synthetase beta chain